VTGGAGGVTGGAGGVTGGAGGVTGGAGGVTGGVTLELTGEGERPRFAAFAAFAALSSIAFFCAAALLAARLAAASIFETETTRGVDALVGGVAL
jgi:hypothetical protein